jgi:NAD(P)-dependent dehydrogenase (short-subunit alcohol dehydrogenase family)
VVSRKRTDRPLIPTFLTQDAYKQQYFPEWSLCRQLAAELGPHGIRVAWLLSPGSPGSDGRDAEHPEPSIGDADGSDAPDDTLLRRRPSYDDVANVATFAASDWARTMTATEINFTGGAVVD